MILISLSFLVSTVTLSHLPYYAPFSPVSQSTRHDRDYGVTLSQTLINTGGTRGRGRLRLFDNETQR